MIRRTRRVVGIFILLVSLFGFAVRNLYCPSLTEDHNNNNRNDYNQPRWSGLFRFLPHLSSVPLGQIEPIYLTPKRQIERKSLVMTIPVVQRAKETYLMRTLSSLTKNIHTYDRPNVMFLIFLSSEQGHNTPFVKNTVELVQQSYTAMIADGTIQMFFIPEEFYPNISGINPTLSDDPERMYWRTKQNLDYMYMFSIGSIYGEYFMQLEDDIISAVDYTRNIFDFIKVNHATSWEMADFSYLGCIGKLMRSSDIVQLRDFVSLFYKYKPIDWLVDDFFKAKYCTNDHEKEECKQALTKYRKYFMPVQFQHIGLHSSLKGKEQPLHEKYFGAPDLGHSRGNPPAALSTSMRTWQNYKLEYAYNQGGHFWAVSPRDGEYILIKFNETVFLSGIMISSGTDAKPDDRFVNETRVAVVENEKASDVGVFSSSGRFVVAFSPPRVVSSVLITINEDLSNWVIIDQLYFAALFCRPVDLLLNIEFEAILIDVRVLQRKCIEYPILLAVREDVISNTNNANVSPSFKLVPYKTINNDSHLTIHDGAVERIVPRQIYIRMGNLLVPGDIDKFMKYWERSRVIKCLGLKMKRNTTTSVLDKKDTIDSLADFQELLTTVDMYPFLISGTLLGWYRECGVIPHTTDADMVVPYKEHNPQLEQLLLSKRTPFDLLRTLGRPSLAYEITVSHEFYDARIDLFYLYDTENGTWLGGTNGAGEIRQFPYPKVDEICSTEIMGRHLWVPCNAEQMVEINYGPDWREDKSSIDWIWDRRANTIGKYSAEELKELFVTYEYHTKFKASAKTIHPA